MSKENNQGKIHSVRKNQHSKHPHVGAKTPRTKRTTHKQWCTTNVWGVI